MYKSDSSFINQERTYRTLKCFQKAECIYDVTFYFAHKYLSIGDRTIDQMIQAARSGKQNLAEGNIDGITSKEMELKLTNVNRASLHELLLDYEDYLRVRGLEHWGPKDHRYIQTATFCRNHLDSAIYREKIRERSDETIANIAITLIHQEDFMLRNLLNRLQDDFVKHGGIKERMFQARLNYRNKTGDKK
jgi:four helix bundle suffix protein